jgi:branched-chain amino acid aminotransferase
MNEIVFLNGKFLPAQEAKILAETPGFLCGLGLFETMRSFNKRIVYFDGHLERIKKSCKFIDLRFPYSMSSLKDIIEKTVKINAIRDAYVRLTLWKSQSGTDILIIAREHDGYSLEKYKSGFTAKIASLRQNEGSFLAQIKTTSRFFYEACLNEAKNKGFDEAIILNNRGYITEATRSNIFLVNNYEIFTPYLACGCLDGITRKAIFGLAKKNNIRAYEGNLTLQDLYQAKEAFLTNSLMGIMPLASVERNNMGKGKIGRITEFFLTKYNLLFKNGS